MRIMRSSSAAVIIFLLVPSAYGEYRAYELQISDQESRKSRTVISTFDHIQYPYYYPLRGNETIQLQDTWRCRGRTDWMKPICPKPDRAAMNPTPSVAPAPNTPTDPQPRPNPPAAAAPAVTPPAPAAPMRGPASNN